MENENFRGSKRFLKIEKMKSSKPKSFTRKMAEGVGQSKKKFRKKIRKKSEKNQKKIRKKSEKIRPQIEVTDKLILRFYFHSLVF